MTQRLDAQMAFLMEADRLKSVTRATPLCDRSRCETSAEHSWHIALYALTLAEHAPEGVAADRVIRMLLLHDLVEIDAGDHPIYGDHDPAETEAAERAAADRIFGLLPADQGAAFRALWEEFEAAQTPDARFARAIDRFQTPNHNLATGGGSWADYGVSQQTVEARVGQRVAAGAPALWAWLHPRLAAWFTARG